MSPQTETRAPTGRLRALLAYKRILWVLLLPAGLLLTALASRFPRVVETVHARGLYRGMRAVFGRLFSLLPVSVIEFGLIALILLALIWLVRAAVRRIRRKPSRRREHPILRPVSTLLCAAGVVYGLFVLTCGLNYHRVSFAEQSGLAVRDSSAQELAALYAELAEEAGALRELVAEDADGVMRLDDSFSALAKAAPAAYDKLAERYPVFGGYTPRAKPVLLSRLMSICRISGIYIPFTFEANVNVDVVDYAIPFNMMHELAHSKGFMLEDEANFIAFLACREMEDVQFRYSGALCALTQTGNALYSADPDLYYALREDLSDAVRRDQIANSLYWQQFESPVGEVATAMNNAYLKANSQADGVKSYGRMVDLLLAEYRQRHGLD